MIDFYEDGYFYYEEYKDDFYDGEWESLYDDIYD